MSDAVDELAERRAVRRAEESRLDTMCNDIRNLMDTMKWSVEQAMDVLKVSDEDREILLKRF